MKRFALALLFVALLSGCVTIQQRIHADPNRPYPPQPSVPAEVASQLAAKKPQEFPVYLSSYVRYRDTTNLPKKISDMEKEKGRGILVSDLPLTLEPPETTIKNATQFMGALKGKLDQAGFRRVETLCEECLLLLVDYADAPVVSSATVCLFSVRFFYLGREVMVARDDRYVWWKSFLSRDETIALAAQRTVEELLQVWNWRVAEWRQKTSAIEPTQQLSAVGK